MASVANETQVNFNPSWMQNVAKGDRAARVDRTSRVSQSNEEELMPPVFAKNRYGREDILALIGKGIKPPDGLDQCPFFVDAPQAPIILQPLSEIEERLQQNINSSKALSSLPKSRQQLINGGASPDVGNSNSGWITAGSGRGGTVRTANRWSGLGSSNGPGGHETSPGYRPRGNLARVGSQGGHGQGNERWSGLSASGAGGHDHTSGYRPRGGMSHVGGRGGGTTGSLRQISAPQTRDSEKFDDSLPNDAYIPNTENPNHSPPVQTSESNILSTNSTSPITGTNTNNFGSQSREPEKIISTASSPSLLARIGHSTSPSTEEPRKPVIPTVAEDKWYYLDPTDTQQGPFETKQMMLWFQNGFFKPDLRVRMTVANGFTTLGELMRVNGTEAPFVQKFPPVSNRPDQEVQASQPVSSVFSSNSNIWGPPTSPAVKPTVNPEADRLWESKQRQLAEEARKLREKEEALRREEQEREEKERRMREMEEDLRRKREEIARLALEREQELLLRQRQLAEFEKQKMAELEAEKQRLFHELLRQKQEKEEDEREKERRKQLEIQEMIEREKEKQRLEIEEKLRREQLEKEANIRRALEQIRMEKEAQEASAKKQIEEEKRRRQQEEENRRMKAKLEEELKEQLRREQVEKERIRQIALERQRGKQRDERTPSPEDEEKGTNVAPWVQVSKMDKAKEKQPPRSQRSLAEIQEEELREMRAQQKEKEIQEQQRKQIEAANAGIWGKASAKIGWTSLQPAGMTSKRSPPIGSNGAPVWNVQAPSSVAPIPPAPQVKSNPQPTNKQIKKNDTKTVAIDPKSDELTKWVINRVRELNPNIEAEVFASFLESVDNPDDCLDYIEGYLGDGKDSKAFHRELINKRIEMRSRAHAIQKDDLSRAAATNVPTSATIGNSAAANSGGGKKKKKGKGSEKVITGFTGFKMTGDPNRFNAGEIDNTPPVSNRRK